MRKSPLGLLTLILVLGGCHRSPDLENRKSLAGTWISSRNFPEGGDFRSSTTIDQSGNYAADLLVHFHGGTQSFQMRGTMVISNGMLVDTMVAYTSTNAPNLPRTDRARIVRFTENELVVNYGGDHGMTNDVVLRREGKQR